MEALFTVSDALHMLNVNERQTATGLEIWRRDVLRALDIMNRKHKKCRWVDKSEHYPLIAPEGMAWLRDVYFNHEMKKIDADILFFSHLIDDVKTRYDDVGRKYVIPSFIADDMTYREIAEHINLKPETVRRAVYKLPDSIKSNSYYLNGQKYLTADAVFELCSTKFKGAYLQYLESVYIMLLRNLTRGDEDE